MAETPQSSARGGGELAYRPGSVWAGAALSALAIIAAGRLLDAQASDYVVSIARLAGINIILAVSLNVINGITGQFSIGHAGFMAVGAYVAAAVTVFGGTALERVAAGGTLDPAHPPLNLFLLRLGGQDPSLVSQALGQGLLLVALLAGGAAAALAGVLVGLPTLRLRGDYLAIATLGFGEIVRVILLNVEALGGASGFRGTEPFHRIPSYANFTNVFLLALVCVLAVTNLKRSTHGRALLAIRESEVAAEAVGIDTTRYKVLAFAFSAFFAGVGGGLLGHHLGMIIPSPSMFGFLRSIEVIVLVVLGGSGSTTGCVLSAVILTVLLERLRDLGDWRMVLYAEILLVMMLVRRQGLLGSRELTLADLRGAVQFLRTRGAVGLLNAAGVGLTRAWAALTARLARPGQSPATAVFASAVLLAPLADLLAAWLLRRPGQPATTYAAEVVHSLATVAQGALATHPTLGLLARDLQQPLLPATLGLAVALLPLALPWSALAFGVAEGRPRSGGLVAGAALLLLWHGAGLAGAGWRDARTVFEAAAAGLLLLASLAWLAARLRARRRAG